MYKQKDNACLKEEQATQFDWCIRYVDEMIGHKLVWS